MIAFDNTEVAFEGKSNKDLRRAYWLFRIMARPAIVKAGKLLTMLAFKLRLPVRGLIKRTIFRQFCGGETIAECETRIGDLSRYHIGTILDYSVEGQHDESGLDHTAQEIIATTQVARGNKAIPFCVFKLTGVARFALLEKVSVDAELSGEEKQEYLRVIQRVDTICRHAAEADTPVFIDAEESWIQPAIDSLAHSMMGRYNREKAIVYNTIQLYRHDRMEFFRDALQKARQGGYKLGVKLVRGAYMEKERRRAETLAYPSPIQPDKAATDRDYDLSLRFAVENLNDIALCAGTHNEASTLYLTELMHTHQIAPSDPRVFFSQLLGMSDHISYNLAKEGYLVAKYVPYGPVREVLPYLFRRAEENTSVKGQTGRELSLIIKERQRRKRVSN